MNIEQTLQRIERLLLLSTKNVLNMAEVCQLTGYSQSHLYQLTSKRQIPFYRPEGKNLFFKKSDVEEWLLRNRVNTITEAEEAAASMTINKKSRKG